MSHLSSRIEVKYNTELKTNKPGPDPDFKIENGRGGENRVQNS